MGENVKTVGISILVFLVASVFRLFSWLNWKKPGSSTSLLKKKYDSTASWYDLLDYPWERKYRQWRPKFVQGMEGDVVELGVGTGRNLAYYGKEVHLVAVDLSEEMLEKAKARVEGLHCDSIEFKVGDACSLDNVDAASADWILASFLCCVLPDELQGQALREMARVLRPGGRFRLVEIQFSPKSKWRAWVQWWYSPFVNWMYGAAFDRRTLEYLQSVPDLKVTSLQSLTDEDTHILIEGVKCISDPVNGA